MYRSKEEWLSWIMDSDSMVQKKLDFVRSNLLRVPQPGDAEELPGYVIMQRNYRVYYALLKSI